MQIFRDFFFIFHTVQILHICWARNWCPMTLVFHFFLNVVFIYFKYYPLNAYKGYSDCKQTADVIKMIWNSSIWSNLKFTEFEINVNRAWTGFYLSPFTWNVKSVNDNFPYFLWFWVKNLTISVWFLVKSLKLRRIGCKWKFTT